MADVVAHLRSSLPEEGCGLLATSTGTGGGRRVRRFYPGDNIDRSPTRYTMDPRQVIAAIEDMDANGWSLGAIVHSHPRTEASPSPTDLREAYDAEAWLLIVSFAAIEPEVRPWSIAPGSPVEIDLKIVNS